MAELDEILADLVEQVEGAVAAAVAGTDGLLVEQYAKDDSDLAAVAAQITNVLGFGRTAMAELSEAGELQEIVLGCSGSVGYVRLLGHELFCLLVLAPEGNLGKARLYGARAAEQLTKVLV